MDFSNLFGVFRISGSGLAAQRKLIEATASNIANIETTDTDGGGPYIPKRVSFNSAKEGTSFGSLLNRASGFSFSGKSSGPHGTMVNARTFDQVNSPTKQEYEPENPKADEQGYVEKPNINLTMEMGNMMVASRAYEANITVLNAAKAMMKKALEI